MDDKLEDKNYWEKRAEQRVLEAEDEAKIMLVKLRKAYSEAKKELDKEIYSFYGKYAQETGLSLEDIQKRLSPQELKSAKTDIERYYKEVQRLGGYSPTYEKYLRGLSARAYMSRLEELKLQMTHLVEDLYRVEQMDFDKNLSNVYEQTYMRTNFNIQQGFGYSMPFSAINPKMVQTAVHQKWMGDNFSDRIWTDKDKLINFLETKFVQGVALGQNPRKIASIMSKEFDTKYSNCVRLARTEFNHIANQATLEGYKQYSATPKYQILATLDNRTSEICQMMDGKIFDVDEAQEGINFPPFHPNCYDNKTEVYTKDGWKLFKDCALDDEFLSVSIDQYIITQTYYLKAKNLIKHKNNGTIYHLKNKDIDLCITKDHNLYVGSFKNTIPQLIPTLLFIKFFNEYKSCNDTQCQLFFLSENFDKISLQDLQISEIPYNDYVYCVELPRYHTLLVRRNGKICWCGNCRTTTIPYFEEDGIDKLTTKAKRLSEGGLVDGNLTYKEWKNNLSERGGELQFKSRKRG